MLYRAVGGREVAVAAAPGGVDVRPLDAETGRGRSQAPRRRVRPRRLLRLRRDRAGAGRARADAARTATAARARPVRVAGHVDHRPAGLAPRGVRDPFASGRTFGEPVGSVYAFPTPERLATASEDELFALGFSRRKAEYVLGLARDT